MKILISDFVFLLCFLDVSADSKIHFFRFETFCITDLLFFGQDLPNSMNYGTDMLHFSEFKHRFWRFQNHIFSILFE